MNRCRALLLPCLLAAGCAPTSPRVVAPATAAQTSALLDRMKSLEGEWIARNPETGKVGVAAIFKTTSSGSAVRQVMFPGDAHEMTNMFHMDGPSLVVTHYCAMGNQPRMRATGLVGNRIDFKLDDVTNLTDPHAGYMGDLTVEFKDHDHFTESWRSFQDGKLGAPTVFDYTRKQ